MTLRPKRTFVIEELWPLVKCEITTEDSLNNKMGIHLKFSLSSICLTGHSMQLDFSSYLSRWTRYLYTSVLHPLKLCSSRKSKDVFVLCSSIVGLVRLLPRLKLVSSRLLYPECQQSLPVTKPGQHNHSERNIIFLCLPGGITWQLIKAGPSIKMLSKRHC